MVIPRYYIHSRTTPNGHLMCAVVDRAFNHRTVREYGDFGGQRTPDWLRRAQAEQLTRELNARHNTWLAKKPERLRAAKWGPT